MFTGSLFGVSEDRITFRNKLLLGNEMAKRNQLANQLYHNTGKL